MKAFLKGDTVTITCSVDEAKGLVHELKRAGNLAQVIRNLIRELSIVTDPKFTVVSAILHYFMR